MQKEEDEVILSQSIKENPNQNFGEGEDGTTLSHSEEPARELNNTRLDSKEVQQRDEEKKLETIEDSQKGRKS